jgi:hypothetical protein
MSLLKQEINKRKEFTMACKDKKKNSKPKGK